MKSTDVAVRRLGDLIESLAADGFEPAARLVRNVALDEPTADLYVPIEQAAGAAAALFAGVKEFADEGDDYSARWWLALYNRAATDYNRRANAFNAARHN